MARARSRHEPRRADGAPKGAVAERVGRRIPNSAQRNQVAGTGSNVDHSAGERVRDFTCPSVTRLPGFEALVCSVGSIGARVSAGATGRLCWANA